MNRSQSTTILATPGPARDLVPLAAAMGKGDAFAPTSTARRRLWEIADGRMCAIVGTCLTIGDLWKIARKLKLVFPEDVREHQVHGYFVNAGRTCSPTARMMSKLLDRKYAVAINQARKCEDEAALAAFWREALGRGDIPGPFWALMSHGALTPDIDEHVYGDVHMLSHLVGASNRADIRRLVAQEERLDALDGDLAAARRRIADHQAAATTALARAERAEADAATLRMAQATAPAPDAAALTAANARIEALDGQIAGARRELCGARIAIRDLKARCAEAEAALAEERTRGDRLDQIMAHLFAGAEEAAPIDLGGRTVAYLGGRFSAAPRLRAAVERANGRFIHHDGGVETGQAKMESALAQADVVVCPVDCVSHNACLKAKGYCKRMDKTFMPLRCASLSSFVIALNDIAAYPAPNA